MNLSTRTKALFYLIGETARQSCGRRLTDVKLLLADNAGQKWMNLTAHPLMERLLGGISVQRIISGLEPLRVAHADGMDFKQYDV